MLDLDIALQSSQKVRTPAQSQLVAKLHQAQSLENEADAKAQEAAQNGTLCRSLPVVPRELEHFTSTKTGEIKAEKKIIHGQKAPLHTLVKTALEQTAK